MIISSSKIRRLIRKIIKEQVGSEYFGKEFIRFKERVSQGERPIEVAEDMLTRLGAGSTRVVFGFRDNPTVVLKVINWIPEVGVNPRTGFEEQQMVDSNKWEADLTMQQKFSDIFPKTFEVADDYSWILSEKVKPLANFEELKNALGLQGEKFSSVGVVKKIQFQALIELSIEYFQKPDGGARAMINEHEDEEETADMSNKFLAGNTKPETVALPRDPVTGHTLKKTSALERRLRKIVSNRHNNKMFAAMGALEIPPREFSPKNLGISEITGKLVLLDASLWKPYVPVRPT